jgi:hypothetical protein
MCCEQWHLDAARSAKPSSAGANPSTCPAVRAVVEVTRGLCTGGADGQCNRYYACSTNVTLDMTVVTNQSKAIKASDAAGSY